MTALRLRRTLAKTVAVLFFLALGGATYQGVATALERRQFPHPGRLVDVGDHQLHLDCTGEGTPTVILEAPASGMSAAWGWVQPAIATITRTCSYDRAGLGWSEAGDRPFDPLTAAEELHTLLQRAGERAPYVMAGQGLGAALAVLYGSMYDSDVAALVLVDAPAPAGGDQAAGSLLDLIDLSPWLARVGLLRVTRAFTSGAQGLPEPSAAIVSTFLNRPDHLARTARELAQWDRTVGLAATVPAGDHPVIRVNGAGPARAALLTDRGRASAVAAAIAGAVAKVS